MIGVARILAMALFLAAAAPPSDSIFHLTSTWTDQDGRRVSLRSMEGTVFILAMVYTHCGATCPMLVAQLSKLDAGLSPSSRERVRFVLVTFDPARDTPSHLKSYAREHQLDLKRYALWTGTPDDTRQLAAVLGVTYRDAGNGDFTHSNVISVVDGSGVVQHRQVGFGSDPATVRDALESLLH